MTKQPLSQESDISIVLTSIYVYAESNTELTEVEEHADKDDEAKPGIKIRDKVNDGNDDVSNSWQHGEYNIAMETERNNE